MLYCNSSSDDEEPASAEPEIQNTKAVVQALVSSAASKAVVEAGPFCEKVQQLVEASVAPPFRADSLPTDNSELDFGTPTPGVPAAAALPSKIPTPTVRRAASPVCAFASPLLEKAAKRRPARRRGRKKKKQRLARVADTAPDHLHYDDPDENMVQGLLEQADRLGRYEEFLDFPFCCARCKCNQETKDFFLAKAMQHGERIAVVQSGTGEKPHRACCHRFHYTTPFYDPLASAVERAVSEELFAEDEEEVYRRTSMRKIEAKNRSAERAELKQQNDSKLAGKFVAFFSDLLAFPLLTFSSFFQRPRFNALV